MAWPAWLEVVAVELVRVVIVSQESQVKEQTNENEEKPLTIFVTHCGIMASWHQRTLWVRKFIEYVLVVDCNGLLPFCASWFRRTAKAMCWNSFAQAWVGSNRKDHRLPSVWETMQRYKPRYTKYRPPSSDALVTNSFLLLVVNALVTSIAMP